MWCLCVCILVLCTNVANGIFERELSALTQNFFENLYSDPFLEKYDFSETTEQFIDEKVEDYVNLMKEKYGMRRRSLKRRSVSYHNELKGEYVVESTNSVEILEKDHYQDVVIFKEKEDWYAASLKKTNQSMKLGLHKYNGTFFVLTSEPAIESSSARNIYAISSNLGSFVISAEEENAKIYLLQDSKLNRIQTLQISDIRDMYLWQNSHGLFMGIVRNPPNGKKTLGFVYKWIGRHFDQVDKFDTLGATSIIAFTIGNSEFLAVANSGDDNGSFEVHSHIYKYNLHNEKYDIHQKIASKGAADIKFSSFFLNGITESFLVVINSKNNADDDLDLAVSIIYKYIDNYFIPFDSLAIREPTKAVIISPPNDGMLLGVSSLSEGLKIYSYDGWIFDEIDFFYNDTDFKSDIVSLKYYLIKDKHVLLAFNEADIQFYELTFRLRKERVSHEEDNITNWCEEALHKEQLQQKKVVQHATAGEPKESYVLGASTSDKTEGIIGDSVDYTDLDLEDLAKIDTGLDEKIKILEEIESKIDNLLMTGNVDNNTFAGLYADEIIVNDSADFKNLKTGSINNVDMKNLLGGKISLHENAVLDNFMFENVEIQNKIPKFLNGNKIENLLRATDDIVIDKLVVHGDVIVKSDIDITGTLNGVTINSANILLNKDQQLFENDFLLDDVQSVNVTAVLINSKKLNSENITISELDNLRVTNLNVDHINGVKFSTLDDFALKITGDQDISATYEIETLNVDVVIINGLISDQHIGDFINTSEGNYTMNNLKFLNDVKVNNLNVETKLNNIKVIKGKLDVLRNDLSEMQYITGKKTFENINSSNPITFLGPITNELLQKSNPVIMVDGELILRNNYTVENATIEDLLQGFDIKLQFSKHTLGDIEKNALLLTDEIIEVPMTFTQEIHVGNLNADIINDLHVSSLIVNGNDEIQNITGSVVIKSDVTITGNTEVDGINNVSLQEFEKTVMNVDDTQTLTGNYHIDKLSVDIITSNCSKLGDNLWSNTIRTDGDTVINGTTTFQTVKINKLKTTNIILNKINGISLGDVLNNAAKEGVEILNGRKSFQTLTVDNLLTNEVYDLEKIPNEIAAAQIQYSLNEDFTLPNTLNVETVNIQGKINNVDARQFEEGWLQESEDREFSQEEIFDTVTIIGSTNIASGKINDLSLNDLVEDTVKIDENFEFDEVEFDNFVFAQGKINLKGNIDGLDLESAVTQGNELIAHKTFNGEIIVDGFLNFKHLINGMNYTELCQFALDSGDSLYNLIVNGTAMFAKGPSVTRINHRPAKQMIDNLWFKDREAIFIGQPDFDEVQFCEDVHVEGLVSGVSLDKLSTNYFSKSKNQTVSKRLNFVGGARFSEGLSAASLNSEGTVCGLIIEEFMRTAILDGPQQTFERVVLADTVEIEDLQGEYLVNNMNLERDVLRYDVDNKVTGRKDISNLVATTLVINRNYLVQDVDLQQWLRDGVRKNESTSIDGVCIFDDEVQFSTGLSIPGQINGMPFDNKTILLKTVLQEISGNFTFNVEDGKHLYFKNMQLAGELNGVDINLLLKGQMYNNDKTKLTSPIKLNNNVSADNIEIQKYYNGVDVTELLHNLTAYTFENYHNNYANLLNITQQIQGSLSGCGGAQVSTSTKKLSFLEKPTNISPSDISYKIRNFDCGDPPRYLDHYEQLLYRSEQSMTFLGVVKGNYRDLAVFYLEINGDCYLSYQGWNEVELFFEHEDRRQINCDTTHVSALNIRDTSFIYMEDGNQGSLYDYQLRSVVTEFLISETSVIHTFALSETGQDCIIFGSTSDYSQIYCKTPDANEFTAAQELHTHISQVSTIESSTTYLITGTIRDQHDGYITLWEYNSNLAKFMQIQIMHVISFSSMSTVYYRNTHYLAIASNHLKGTKYPGEIQIRKFNPSLERFVPLQTIDVESPINVHFSVLPSEELVLYVETQGVMESFVVYIYEGIFGFTEKVSAKISGRDFRPIKINEVANLVIVHDGWIKVIQGVFK